MKTLLWVAFAIGWVGIEAQRRNFYSQTNMPVTSFSCRDKILGGYYADPETDCQMFHVCVKVPGQGVQDYKFLCPNNTSFDQENQICDDWFNIDCEAATLFYSDNFDLYRIGSDYDSGRVSPGVKLPTNNINNAVSDVDDDYLRRADRGESIGNDLLRGSHSSNFFSNKNQGREDEEEVKKKPPTGKSGVRKLLTGKRPLPSTTSAAPQPTQAAPVEPVTQRQNFAGRNRGASNYRGTFRSYNSQAPQQQTQQQQQPTAPAEPQRINYNTAAPSTQKQNYYTTAAPVTQRQNYYTTPAQTQRANYYSTAATTQRSNYYTTAAPTSAPVQRQNYYTAAPAAPTQRQNSFYSPTTTQQQQPTGAQGFTATVQNQYYNPSTQNQAFNNYQTSTTRNYQNYQTTPAPAVYTETANYDATNDYTRATNNNYETAKLFKSNVAAQSNPNYFNGNYNADKFDDGASGEFLKTAPSQNLGAANFNRVQNIYKGFNTSVVASYNTEPVNATTLKPVVNNFSNYATINRNNYVNTSPKPAYNQYSTTYNQEQTYSTVAPNYYSQTTTQKPFVQPSYNGTTATRNNYYNGATAANTQTQNAYNPTTQYTYYTTTTQKPASSQNYYQTSQQHTQSSPNYYTTTTQKPVQNFYNPSAPAQQTGFYNQGTTQAQTTAQNYYNQAVNVPKAAVQKPSGQKKYSSPAVNYSQTQSSPAPFRGGNRGTPIPDQTEKPRPFSTTTASPAKDSKAEKDQYDYAYYDDATHTEYDSLDTVEFVKTKSKARSKK